MTVGIVMCLYGDRYSVWFTSRGGLGRGTRLFIRSFFFFFQAEDGIRDYKVTGVQTCALPILQLLVDERPLLERTSHAPLLFLSPRHDHGIRRTRAPARLVALGRLAPRGHRVVALALALAAAHRVVDGVHDGAAHGRPEALPAHAPGLADLQAVRRDDVALLAVAVVQQGQPRRAIRVVLDRRHARRDAELVAPEVHVAQHPLRPAAPVADGDAAVHVAPVGAPLG